MRDAFSFPFILSWVQTIQIGEVTTIVPPLAFIIQDTVAAALVIIKMLGGKWHATMIGKRVTVGSCKKKKQGNIGAMIYLGGILGILRKVFASCKFAFLQQ